MRALPEIENYFRKRLEERIRNNSFRNLEYSSGLIDFISNDYLGIAKGSVNDFNALVPLHHGSGGSRLLGGNTELAEKVEQEIAMFHQSDSALLYTSGYTANIGLFSCIAGKDDTILYDEHIHASVRDGIRLSFSKSMSFAHNNTDDLRKKIARSRGRIFIAVESVYSMGGDQAPLMEICKIAGENNAGVIVDEAHATGIFGENGEGLVCEKKLQQHVFARVVTFGKALGCHGAAVLGSENFIKYLINFSRSFIYTTALPDSVLQIIRLHYQKMKSALMEREQLKSHIEEFKKVAEELDLGIIPSSHPIQGVIIPGNDAVKKCAEFLRENGMGVKPILSPTVPEGKERIRICLHSYNTVGEITYLLHHLKTALHA